MIGGYYTLNYDIKLNYFNWYNHIINKYFFIGGRYTF